MACTWLPVVTIAAEKPIGCAKFPRTGEIGPANGALMTGQRGAFRRFCHLAQAYEPAAGMSKALVRGVMFAPYEDVEGLLARTSHLPSTVGADMGVTW